MAQPLGYLRGRGHELLVIRVLDPNEIELDFKQSTMLVDAETGREMYIDPQAARTEYQNRFPAPTKRSSTMSAIDVRLGWLLSPRTLRPSHRCSN